MKNRPAKKFIKNLISLPGSYFFLLKCIYKQRGFLKKEIEEELLTFKDNNDGSLTSGDFKKIISYYALGVPGILGELTCVLRGRQMAINERFCLSFLGGISGLLDDLFDDPEKQDDHLEGFIVHPESMMPQNSCENLLLHLYQKGLAYSENPEQLKLQALEVYRSQQQSKLQIAPDNPSEAIASIIYDKGGSSFIFYISCFNHPVNDQERELFFHLGGLMQLGNDIYDVWEDHQSGIRTLATTCTEINALRTLFIREMKKMALLAYKTSYPKKQVSQFIKITGLAISRVFVCLDQFEKLQILTGNKFCVEDYDRKQLICDMQNPKNQLKAIAYYLKF